MTEETSKKSRLQLFLAAEHILVTLYVSTIIIKMIHIELCVACMCVWFLLPFLSSTARTFSAAHIKRIDIQHFFKRVAKTLDVCICD